MLGDTATNLLALSGGILATAAIAISIEGSVGIVLRPVERLVLTLAAAAAIAPIAWISLSGMAVIIAIGVRYGLLLQKKRTVDATG